MQIIEPFWFFKNIYPHTNDNLSIIILQDGPNIKIKLKLKIYLNNYELWNSLKNLSNYNNESNH